MVETVVVLPVVLLLFLGLWFFKDLVDTRMRAVEAARYLTWEAVWNARENRPNRAIKDDATLRQDLQAMGLGKNLVTVQAGKRRSLNEYVSSIPNGAGTFTDIPQFVAAFFQNPDRSATSSSVTPGTTNVPGFDSVDGPLQSILATGGDLTFRINDFFAKTTKWDEEADGAVHTSFVTYRVRATSVFRFLGDTDISQTGSVLGHPYNVVRSSNQTEYDRVFGQKGVGDCFTGSGQGHIFPLWFVPSVPVPGVQQVANVGKCFLTEFGSVLGLGDFLGGDLGFKIPDGTLKEYPEKNL